MADSRTCGLFRAQQSRGWLAIQQDVGRLCNQEVVTAYSGGFTGRHSHSLSSRHRFRVRMSSSGKEGEPEEVVGNKQVQDQLVKMLRLQTGKMRVRDFVDERSSYLTDIAEQAKAEGDKIAEDTLRSIDEAGSKVRAPCVRSFRSSSGWMDSRMCVASPAFRRRTPI